MRRGEIYVLDFGRGRGRELRGRNPVVVVSNDFLNSLTWMVVVVPGFDSSRGTGSWPEVHVTAAESGAPHDIAFTPIHIRAFDPSRFPTRPVGTVPVDKMAKIDTTLRTALELPG